MKNLYTFNKNSNHVKLFKWLWNVDPTLTFKSMCPYFWSYVVTILILPILLIAKLFGKYGKQFNSYLFTYRKKRKDKIIAKLIKKSKTIVTPEDAYSFQNTGCYKKYQYYLEFEERMRLDNLYDERRNELYIVRKENLKKRNEKIQQAKENKIITIVMWVILGAVLVTSCYLLYLLGAWAIGRIDWWTVLKVIGGLVAVVAAVFGLIGLFKYVLDPIYDKLKCITLPNCKLCQLPIGTYILSFFTAIGTGFMILIDMIRNTYKKNCPIITWEDE